MRARGTGGKPLLCLPCDGISGLPDMCPERRGQTHLFLQALLFWLRIYTFLDEGAVARAALGASVPEALLVPGFCAC